MSERAEERVRDALVDARAPAESAAEERGWQVLRAVLAERQPVSRRRIARRAGLALAGAGALAALALTPAGADVRDWIADTIAGDESAQPVLGSLPASGAVLTEGGDGSWIVRDDGSRRRLGDFDHATWSPNGLYVGASNGSELSALDPQGVTRWVRTLDARIRSLDWSSDEGYRLAYVAGDELHVLPADNSTDPVRVATVSSPAIAWQPESSDAHALHRLAYVDDGRLTVANTDTGRVVWSTPPLFAEPEALQWSASGDTLAVLAAGSVLVFDGEGGTPVKGPIATGVTAAALAPDGDRLAVVRPTPGAGTELALVPTRPGAAPDRVLYETGLAGAAGRFGDPIFSPDGEWILLPWPQADQWFFVPAGDGRVQAVAEISRQLGASGRGPGAFPRVSGWCC